MDFPAAVCGTVGVPFGVLGTGPTGARSRSRASQSEVTEGLGLRHWDAPHDSKVITRR